MWPLLRPPYRRRHLGITHLQAKTKLSTRRRRRIDLAGLLPKQVGPIREGGVVLGQNNGRPVRLILVKVPEEGAEERKERIRRTTQTNGDSPSEDILTLAQ